MLNVTLSEKEYLKSQIIYIEEFMYLPDAQQITDFAKEKDESFAEFGNNEKEFTVFTFNDSSSEVQDMRELVTAYGQDVYNMAIHKYGYQFKDFDPNLSHIARFSEGWGMHEHFDAGKPNDIATLIYLNDDYEGGEIYFPDYDISYKPKPGDLLMFPDNPNFIHGVRPITKGIRYTTPRWFTRIV